MSAKRPRLVQPKALRPSDLITGSSNNNKKDEIQDDEPVLLDEAPLLAQQPFLDPVEAFYHHAATELPRDISLYPALRQANDWQRKWQQEGNNNNTHTRGVVATTPTPVRRPTPVRLTPVRTTTAWKKPTPVRPTLPKRPAAPVLVVSTSRRQQPQQLSPLTSSLPSSPSPSSTTDGNNEPATTKRTTLNLVARPQPQRISQLLFDNAAAAVPSQVHWTADNTSHPSLLSYACSSSSLTDDNSSVNATSLNTAVQTTARQTILHELAVTGGLTNSIEFQQALEILQQANHPPPTSNNHYYSTTNTTWLTLSKEIYNDCQGFSSTNGGGGGGGDPLYTLGRLTFDMMGPTHVVCSLQGTFLQTGPVSSPLLDRRRILPDSLPRTAELQIYEYVVPCQTLLKPISLTLSLLHTQHCCRLYH